MIRVGAEIPGDTQFWIPTDAQRMSIGVMVFTHYISPAVLKILKFISQSEITQHSSLSDEAEKKSVPISGRPRPH